MAHALGHEVSPCPDGTIECGYYETLSNDLPPHVYYWHRDGILLNGPEKNVTCLGSSTWRAGKTTHAFRVKNSLGVQFHPEVTEGLIQTFLKSNEKDLVKKGARSPESHLAGHKSHGDRVRLWLENHLKSTWDFGCS